MTAGSVTVARRIADLREAQANLDVLIDRKSRELQGLFEARDVVARRLQALLDGAGEGVSRRHDRDSEPTDWKMAAAGDRP